MNTNKKNNSQRTKLVNPNLGHPKFIQGDTEKDDQKYEFQLLLVSNIEDKTRLKALLEENLSLIPIIEYKWKLRQIFEEKKKGLKAVWRRIKRFFTRKSKKEKEISEKLHKLEPRGYRGDPIKLQIIKIEYQSEMEINNIHYLDDEYCKPQQYLEQWKVFKNLNKYFCLDVSFSLSKETKSYFSERDFIMFDIECFNTQTNYHALVLTKKNWKDFKFIHITDTHLADRNDKIFEIVSNWESASMMESVGNFFGDVANKIKSIFKKNSKKEKEEMDQKKTKHEIKILKKSLEKRFINPNNQLRKLIKIANKKVLENDLDFMVLTGDIVDFVIKGEFSEKVNDLNKIKLNQTNWKVFHDIILNKEQKEKHVRVLKSQELLCPIFTIVGNHDYRPYHYDLTWAGLYKKIGLTSSEASALNELFSANPISSISKSNLALKPYLRNINPSLDFSITLGEVELVFLNSGSDSFKNFRDLLSGHPSVTGLNDIQIKYLENLINQKFSPQKEFLLLIHGPPINIGKSKYFRKRLQEIGKTDIRKKIEDFKESILKKVGKEDISRRIDTSFNVKHGTVSSNWEELIQFCKNYTLLTLSGHTHVLKEFRLGETKEKSTVYDAPPFILKKLQNPAAVYYDVYSEKYDNAEDIKKDGPFIVQTPALGLGSYKKPKIFGAYRIIKFEGGKLISFKPKFLE